MIVYAGAPSDVPSGSAGSKYFFLLRHSQKMMVPAVVYLVMNILGFVALGNIDAATNPNPNHNPYPNPIHNPNPYLTLTYPTPNPN